MRRPFSLSPRLMAVAGLVPRGVRLVDVGTDHGRLPVWLVQHGVIASAVATDLREKPLSKARELARRWNIPDKVSFRLCDGLTEVSPDEAQVVTITGMGGETIADILHGVPWTGEEGHTYILQPMTGADGLRRYLSTNGFHIERELLVEEEGTLYLILLVRPGKDTPYSEGEIWVGRQSRGMASPLRGRYLDQELSKLCWAIEGLTRSRQPEDVKRKESFEQVAREVNALKKEWDAWQR